MPEFNVDVVTADGAMDCFVAYPDGAYPDGAYPDGTHSDGDGPYAPVIIYMDVPGIREELRDFARRIAGEGFYAVLPDLYYREGKVRFDLRKGESELKKMFAVGGALSNAMIMRDTQGILNYLSDQPQASEHVGTIGYCMSGQFVLSAAGTFPEQIKATAALYGTRMVTDKDDSPHKLIGAIQGEFYMGFAAHDPFVEDFVVPTLDTDMQAAGINFTLKTFADTEHGFCFPQRPGYVEDAAEEVWQDVFAMYRRQL